MTGTRRLSTRKKCKVEKEETEPGTATATADYQDTRCWKNSLEEVERCKSKASDLTQVTRVIPLVDEDKNKCNDTYDQQIINERELCWLNLSSVLVYKST